MHLNFRLATVGAVSVLAVVMSPMAAVAQHGGHDVIRADLVGSMPLPDGPVLNGVNPGSLPWQIARGEVRVRSNGRMDVRIEGLQIPRNGGADNPIGSIDAVLYCNGSEEPAADSGPQPMTIPGGDARFRVFLSVPKHCDMASVLISPSTAVGGAYIANSVMAD